MEFDGHVVVFNRDRYLIGLGAPQDGGCHGLGVGDELDGFSGGELSQLLCEALSLGPGCPSRNLGFTNDEIGLRLRVGEQTLAFRVGCHIQTLLLGLNCRGGGEGRLQQCFRLIAQPLCVLLGIGVDLGGLCGRPFCCPDCSGGGSSGLGPEGT